MTLTFENINTLHIDKYSGTTILEELTITSSDATITATDITIDLSKNIIPLSIKVYDSDTEVAITGYDLTGTVDDTGSLNIGTSSLKISGTFDDTKTYTIKILGISKVKKITSVSSDNGSVTDNGVCFSIEYTDNSGIDIITLTYDDNSEKNISVDKSKLIDVVEN